MNDLKELYKAIKDGNKKPCGVYTLCNFGGIAIYEILYNIDDKAVSGFDFGEGAKNVRATKIYCTISGRSYIVRYGCRYYLDDFMKV